MKIKLKIFLLINLLLCTYLIPDIKAQRNHVTADFFVGLNFAEMDIEGANMYKELKVGMLIGGNVNFKVYNNFQIQTGFYVTKKGLKQHIESTYVDEVANIAYEGDTLHNYTANYLQIPLCLGYEFYFTKDFAINLNLGLYGAYGFRGKYYNEASEKTIKNGVITNMTVRDPYEADLYVATRWTRWDYGLIGRIGLIYDIYQINLSYEYGLKDLSAVGNNEILKNRNIALGLGFRF